MEQLFTFDSIVSKIYIEKGITFPFEEGAPLLFVCDVNTEYLARKLMAGRSIPLCVLKSGEAFKDWASVEAILQCAKNAELGRDGIFCGIGGGVVSDMTAFAASVYMRGARLALVATTLLAMVDAAMGGKTGFDLFNMKNFIGTFYPASYIFMPLDSLRTLPRTEWKSGLAELIKTAVLDADNTFFEKIEHLAANFSEPVFPQNFLESEIFLDCIVRSIAVKGRVVEMDPKETGTDRALLNLGHTFGHALESSVGLGEILHGEAVAWGIARACELGCILGITGSERSKKINKLLHTFGYETAAPHPLIRDRSTCMAALLHDKKKKAGKLTFVVPAEHGGQLVPAEMADAALLERIVCGVPL
jgi:3-dehydroquinate synthase